MVRTRRVLLLGWVGLWLLIVQSPARAILIETSNKRKIAGYTVSEDAKKIVIRCTNDDGTSKDETFLLANIKILHRIDRNRLAKLHRDEPDAYRDYADQLAKHKDDPEAVDLAKRLYLIAASLAPAKHGRECLLAMSNLAAGPAEARKYRAMAFLLDGKRDPALLQADALPAPRIAEAAWKTFAQALRKFRNGEVIEARELAKAAGVGACFRATPGMMDQPGFIQACGDALCPQCKFKNRHNLRCATCAGKGRNPFGQFCPTCNGKGIVNCSACDGTGIRRTAIDEHVDAMTRGELWALDQLAPDVAPAPKRGELANWSSALSRPQLTPIPVLTLDTIADFDPRKCVYRNGSWVAP